ncbi:hypothetical protein APHNP_1347 [Anaplasma phagocytophilum str. ApNP]|uniref:Uncharacterized protein n=1 Tax=Anaplasma phagocytophilum str. ApNP TaxID=1359153 RepID=A0A0F3NIL3_ANAPH|nr:hypothetical protein APHNP_1347 [Anaplasma phagocytophilum str. ApNP]
MPAEVMGNMLKLLPRTKTAVEVLHYVEIQGTQATGLAIKNRF